MMVCPQSSATKAPAAMKGPKGVASFRPLMRNIRSRFAISLPLTTASIRATNTCGKPTMRPMSAPSVTLPISIPWRLIRNVMLTAAMPNTKPMVALTMVGSGDSSGMASASGKTDVAEARSIFRCKRP